MKKVDEAIANQYWDDKDEARKNIPAVVKPDASNEKVNDVDSEALGKLQEDMERYTDGEINKLKESFEGRINYFDETLMKFIDYIQDLV